MIQLEALTAPEKEGWLWEVWEVNDENDKVMAYTGCLIEIWVAVIDNINGIFHAVVK